MVLLLNATAVITFPYIDCCSEVPQEPSVAGIIFLFTVQEVDSPKGNLPKPLGESDIAPGIRLRSHLTPSPHPLCGSLQLFSSSLFCSLRQEGKHGKDGNALVPACVGS